MFKNKLKSGICNTVGFPGGSVIKNPPANVGDVGLISRSRRSPEGRNCNTLQYACLRSPMDGETWWATVHWFTKSWT